MTRRFKLATLLSLSLAWSAQAIAGTFDFSLSPVYSSNADNLVSSHGVFHTAPESGGAFLVTGISGERDGVAISGLSAYASADQLLFPAWPFVDYSGISFTAGSDSFNLFSNNGTFELAWTNDPIGYAQSSIPVALSVTPVPEPASIALFATFLLCLAVFRYRRVRTARAVT